MSNPTKKVAFIIPYFGTFNNYFQLFLNSCSYNTGFDWIIFTNDKRSFQIPDNVIFHYISFENLKKLIQGKFDFQIYLNRPYKLCDFKVAYGYIFEEYLKDYSFWGHCDTDLIFGNLSKFITEEDLLNYDKIGFLGHCTLYKNIKEVNMLFMRTLEGKKRYKEVYQNNENCSFDEEFKNSINNIFEEYGYRIRYDQYEANIYTKSSDFKLTWMDLSTQKYVIEPRKKAFFLWDKGALVRYSMEDYKLEKNEYMYIHMQSRPMQTRFDIQDKKIRYKIIPNSFSLLEVNAVDKLAFKRIRIKYFNLHYFILRSKNLVDKIQKRLKKLKDFISMDNKRGEEKS